MKRRILSLCLSLVLAVGLLPMGALTASAATINFNGLPVLDITLNKPLELIHASKNNAATDGQVTLYDTTGKQKVSARLAQFKGRGNASWKMAGDKRSYNLKCSEAVELIPGAGKGKNWVLIANNVIYDVIDRTGLANMAPLRCIGRWAAPPPCPFSRWSCICRATTAAPICWRRRWRSIRTASASKSRI